MVPLVGQVTVDRFNRIMLRTLKPLTDLQRRTPPITIHQAGHVDLGAQRVNLAVDGQIRAEPGDALGSPPSEEEQFRAFEELRRSVEARGKWGSPRASDPCFAMLQACAGLSPSRGSRPIFGGTALAVSCLILRRDVR
jgi:hypothetical protein